MPSSLKLKKKPLTLTKATSDSQLPKTFVNTQKLIMSSRADLEHSDQGKDLIQTLRSPHKANHFLNLQIPSLAHANSSKMGIKSKIVSSKTLKSPRATSLKKKKSPESDFFRTPVNEEEMHKNERIAMDEVNEETKLLEKELQKALEENKKLKTKVHNGKVGDEYIEEIMKKFSDRLKKLLYESN